MTFPHVRLGCLPSGDRDLPGDGGRGERAAGPRAGTNRRERGTGEGELLPGVWPSERLLIRTASPAAIWCCEAAPTASRILPMALRSDGTT